MMKEQKPINWQSKQPKKNTAFLHKELGTVFLYHVRCETCYIVSTDPLFKTADDMMEVKPSELSLMHQKRSTSLKSTPKVLTAEEKAHKASLNVFFASEMLTLPYLCDCCNKPLKAFTNEKKRCCIAHIIPKKTFKSVAAHPQNRLFLGSSYGNSSCTCHDDYDGKGVEFRKQMNCYPLAIERFNQFKDLLTQAEYIAACTYLGIEWQ